MCFSCPLFFILQDQFENLDKHTQWGIDFLERYGKFVKERLEIEQNYAKQLRYITSHANPKKVGQKSNHEHIYKMFSIILYNFMEGFF